MSLKDGYINDFNLFFMYVKENNVCSPDISHWTALDYDIPRDFELQNLAYSRDITTPFLIYDSYTPTLANDT